MFINFKNLSNYYIMTKYDLAGDEIRYSLLLTKLKQLKKQQMEHHSKISQDPTFANNNHMVEVYKECYQDSEKQHSQKEEQIDALNNLLYYLEKLRDENKLSNTLDNECVFDMKDIVTELKKIDNDQLY